MLELIFNPFFDQPVYSGEEQPDNSSLRKKYVGKLGLLEELKLRLGLTSVEISDSERLVSFYKAVNEADLNDSSLFFHESFSNDPLGVAALLLKWRDALVYAGWKNSHVFTSDPSCLSDSSLSSGAKAKFVGLAAIEEIFSAQEDFYLRKGTSDFWMDVLKDVQEDGDDLSFLSISVAMTESLLKESDPMLYYILSLLSEKCHAHVKYDDCELENENQKVHLFTIPDQLDAYQWLFAGQHEPELQELDKALEDNRVLLINEDNVSLNGVFDCLGKPHVESQFDNVNTSLLQLFRNGLTQFRKPVDFKGLQDYLSSPYHPLGDFIKEEKNKQGVAYKCSLKLKLLNYLQSRRGFGRSHFDETWDEILNDSEFLNTESAFVPSDVLGFWTTGASRLDTASKCYVKVASVSSYCSVMAQWCRSKKTSSATVRGLLEQVRASFKMLRTVLEIYGKEEIPYDALMKYANAINSLPSLSGSEDHVGAVRICKHPAAIAQVVERPVVWLDCYDKGSSVYEYDFIVQNDCEIMNQTGMYIPSKEAVCRQEYKSMKRGLALVDDVYLISPEKVFGQRHQNHQIFIEFQRFKQCPVYDCTNWSMKGSEIQLNAVQVADSQELQYMLASKPIRKEMLPDHESASSLETLLNNPYDYVLDNVYGLKEVDSARLSTLKGSVAHLFIHNAFEEANVNGELTADELEHYVNDRFDVKVDDAAYHEGVELLSPENKFDYERFKEILVSKSLPNLIQIMRQYNLVMIGSEFEINGKSILKCSNKSCCPLTGSIDCILKDEQNHPIIFDFKWTESNTGLDSRESEVKENTALQLCIYRMAMEQILQTETFSGIAKNTQVEGIGYYMLKQGQLFTDCSLFYNSTLDFIKCYVQDRTAFDLLCEQICNLYEFRIKQILDGEIEEAEQMKNSSVSYFQAIQAKESLFPIKDLKKDRQGNYFALEKKTTYGKHQVMKGRLK